MRATVVRRRRRLTYRARGDRGNGDVWDEAGGFPSVTARVCGRAAAIDDERRRHAREAVDGGQSQAFALRWSWLPNWTGGGDRTGRGLWRPE